MARLPGFARRLLDLAHVDPYHNLDGENVGARVRKAMSPRYVVDKIAATAYERTHPEDPWIARDGIKIFDALLRPHHRGLEWGSGNGSMWIAARCRSLVSVEHHAEWHAEVLRRIQSRGVKNVDYRLVHEDRYLEAVSGMADESLDFVVVDGLFRDRTLEASMRLVRPDGFILFDNANWYLPSNVRAPHSRSHDDGPDGPIFGRLWETLRSWKIVWATDGVNASAFLIRPA